MLQILAHIFIFCRFNIFVTIFMFGKSLYFSMFVLSLKIIKY